MTNGPMTEAREGHVGCESCGDAAGREVLAVHRAYVTPAAWDSEAAIDVQAEVEHWCLACRAHYPHQVVGAAAPET